MTEDEVLKYAEEIKADRAKASIEAFMQCGGVVRAAQPVEYGQKIPQNDSTVAARQFAAQREAAERAAVDAAKHAAATVAEKADALRRQVGGSHYKGLKIQPAEYNHANGLGHLAGDAVAYITRAKFKDGLEAYRKAIHSLELLIELEERANG